MNSTQESISKEKPPAPAHQPPAPAPQPPQLPEKTARSSGSTDRIRTAEAEERRSVERKSASASEERGSDVFKRRPLPKPLEDPLLTRHNAYIIKEQLKQKRYDKDADPMESPPLEVVRPLLGVENEETLLDVEDVNGPFTVELSEFSEHEYQDHSSFFVRNLVERVSPALTDRTTRPYVLANITVLTGTIFLVIIMVIVGNYGTINSRVKSQMPDDVPCLYKYTEWTACPQRCTENRAQANVRSRSVVRGSIIQARGIYKALFPCPHDLAEMVETVPCNTHLCPRNMTDFPFAEKCHFSDITKTADPNATCYQLRNLFDLDPKDRDISVLIDGMLTRPCNCPIISVE